MAPDLSVLIVNYKTPGYLETCLRSFLERSFPFSLEIVVVDNDSRDGSVEMLRERFPSVRVIANAYNYGFAVANNQAFRATTGRYVMPVNPDTEALPGCLEELVSFLDANPKAGLACPVNVTSEGALKVPMTRFHLFSLATLRVLQQRLGFSEHTMDPGEATPFKADWCWTTGFVCRRSALPGPDLFSEDMFLFGEEYNLCRGLRDRGYDLYILPRARLTHHASVTWSKTPMHIAVARRLQMGVLWEIRRREFGEALASLSQGILGGEAAVIWAYLRARGLLRGQPRPTLEADYLAQAEATLGVLLGRHDYVRRVNTEARLYFNDGVDAPPLPPT